MTIRDNASPVASVRRRGIAKPSTCRVGSVNRAEEAGDMALQSAAVYVVAVRGHEAEILAALRAFDVIGLSSVRNCLPLLTNALAAQWPPLGPAGARPGPLEAAAAGDPPLAPTG